MGKKKGRVQVERDIEAFPPPMPDRAPRPKKETPMAIKKSAKKGTAQVQWKTEAIPMPLPKDRKPRPKKKSR